MAQATLLAANNMNTGSSQTSASTTNYIAVCNNSLASNFITTESFAQIKFTGGGTISGWSVGLNTNSIATASSSVTRVNAGNGNGSLALTASTTGWFTDGTHTDTIVTSDLFCGATTTGTGGGTLQVIAASASFSASGTATAPWGTQSPGASTFYNRQVQSDLFFPAGGDGNQSSTSVETNVTTKIGSSGSAHHLRAWTATNSNNASCTLTFRKNTAAGNNVVTFSAAATGASEDTTHTDTLAAGDLVALDWNASGVSSGTQTCPIFNIWVDVSGTGQNIFPGLTAAKTGTTTVQNFVPVVGRAIYTTTEAIAQVASPLIAKWSNIQIKAASATATTWRSRINGSNGNQSFVINATGYFTDSTHTDTLAVNDKICLGATPTAATTPNQLLDSSSVLGAAVSTETGTAILSFSGIAFSGTGSDAHGGTARLAFGPIAFAGAGTDKHSGTGILAFAGISIIAGGSELGAPGDGKRFFWTF